MANSSNLGATNIESNSLPGSMKLKATDSQLYQPQSSARLIGDPKEEHYVILCATKLYKLASN